MKREKMSEKSTKIWDETGIREVVSEQPPTVAKI